MKARKVYLKVMLLLLISVLYSSAHAITYVAANGNDANGGTSWADAVQTIQKGVDIAALPASDDIVWVAVGDVPPPALPSQPAAIPYVENVIISPGVAIYGGFRGDETEPFDLTTRTLKTIINTPVAANSIIQAGANSVIDGFIIENGQADLGAGIRVIGSPVIVNNDIIRDNTSRLGAGIYSVGATLLVSECQFNGNKANDTSGNQAAGASIYAQNGYVNLTHNTFTGERTYISNTSGAQADGGAVYISGGTLARLDRNVFESCVANGTLSNFLAYGGAVYVDGVNTSFTNNLFHNCEAEATGSIEPAAGGAIYFHNQGTVGIINNTFVANQVTPQAGNLSDSDRPYGLGSAIYVTGSTTANIINNIITDGRGTAVVNDGMIMTFNYNLLWHNCGGDIYGFNFPVQNPPNSVDGNIMKCPQFLIGDPLFHITYGSPAKDAGVKPSAPGTDIDGETRPFNIKIDIGADEFVDTDNDGGADITQDTASPGYIDPPTEQDPDGDGIYTPYDNSTLYNPSQLDSNGDGIADVDTDVTLHPAYYVSPTGNDSNDGYSWATAFRTIQHAIDAADLHNVTNVDGATPWTKNPEVWVLEGTYNENIQIWHGVHVYGGWNTGFVYGQIPDPHPLRHVITDVSTINGQNLDTTVTIAHLPQDRYLTNPTKQTYDNLVTTIDGFSIINGSDELGGGVSNYKDTANICACNIQNSTAALGGGVYIYKAMSTLGDGVSAPTLNIVNQETQVIGNIATGAVSYAGYGGGIYVERGTPLVFANMISGNTAYYGGGISARLSSPSIIENQIGCPTSVNTATGAGTSPGMGGGIYLEDSWADINMNTILSNVASPFGIINGQGGGVWVGDTNSTTLTHQVTLKNSILAYNNADDGSAIWTTGTLPTAATLLSPIMFVTYDDFYLNVGTNLFFPLTFDPLAAPTTNLAIDPVFTPVGCAYVLDVTSPLRGAGDPLDSSPNIGAYQDEDPPATIGEAKMLGNNVVVEISNVVVTAVFSDCFYIEELDRSSGIRVSMSNPKVKEGQLVNVTGTITNLGRDREIVNPTITVAAGSMSVVPLGMSNRSVGGASDGNTLPGVTGAKGLNNVGLLIRTWGKVTEVDSDAGPSFIINDGTGVGVKVLVNSVGDLPIVGQFVAVSGISSLDIDSGGKRSRVIRTRRSSDINYSTLQ